MNNETFIIQSLNIITYNETFIMKNVDVRTLLLEGIYEVLSFLIFIPAVLIATLVLYS
jgi:hypothetical protein